MKTLAILLVILTIFIPTTTIASEPQGQITKVPWSGTLVNDLDPNLKHQIPFPGVLLDSVAWATIQAEKDKHKKELELKDLERLRIEIKKDGEIDQLKIELKWTIKTFEDRIKVKDQYTERLEKMIKDDADDINWVPWAFVGGVVIGAAVVIGVVYGVK